MPLNHLSNSAFLRKLSRITEINLADENFGVIELAQKMELSRSQLHRKLKSAKNISVSQFIREIRLNKAKEMLLDNLGSVSEIAYKVGFASPSYFIKCFHEYYGYPPGEFIKYSHENRGNTSSELNDNALTVNSDQKSLKNNKLSFTKYKVAIIGILTIVVLSFFVYHYFKGATEETSPISTGKSIAVLPLNIKSNNIEDKELVDGLMADIRYRLSQNNKLVVTSSLSSEIFINLSYSSMEIDQILGADYFVDGKFIREGKNLMVYISLNNAKNSSIIWSDHYELTEVSELATLVSTQIADTLHVELTVAEMEQIEKMYPQNIDAYFLYLKGRFFWDKRSNTGIKESIELFRQAVEKDSNYALAWSGLADAYTILTGYGWSSNKIEDEKMAKECALKALEIDSKTAEAHASLGFILAYKEWKWEEAEKELIEAIRLNPNYAFAHHLYSLLLDIQGNHLKAKEENNLALQLDPLSTILHYEKATFYYNEGNFDKSLKECKEILDLEPEHPYVHFWVFKNYYRQGNGLEALNELQIMLQKYNQTQEYIEMAKEVYVANGRDGLIDLILKITKEVKPGNVYWKSYMSELYAIAGDKKAAVTCLENSLKTNSDGDRLVRLINNPDYINLHSEPRFKEVVKKLGLMEYYKKVLTNSNKQAKRN